MDTDWKVDRIWYDGKVVEESQIRFGSTWYRWRCTECGTVLRNAAPCEWSNLDTIRKNILGLWGSYDKHERDECMWIIARTESDE